MTGRLPFDPAKMAAKREAAAATPAAAVASASAADAPLTVGQVAALIDAALRAATPTKVRVIGQVSNFTNRTHWYFALKDAAAVVSCVMFQGRARGVAFEPANGQEVVATGKVEFYAPQGRVTFVVEKLEPVGAGALELAYRALCAELKGLGWFDVERKRALPTFPRRVAVVTSRTGAALQDVLDTMRRRCPAVEVALVDVLVQGATAAPSVAGAIDWLSREHERLGVDVILVTRGGGSMEDLWAFNERLVAEAIVRCRVPVAAAIGHETDTTIAELVADERCATPTQAAMRLTPDARALAEQTELTRARLSGVVRRGLRERATAMEGLRRHLPAAARGSLVATARRFEQLAARVEAARPAAVYAARRTALAQLAADLRSAMRQTLASADLGDAARRLAAGAKGLAEGRRAALASIERQLELVGPASVLKRGYSVTFDERGRVVRDPTDVRAGERLTTRLAEGTIRSTVDGDEPATPRTPAEAARPLSPRPVQEKKARREAAPEAPGLFG